MRKGTITTLLAAAAIVAGSAVFPRAFSQSPTPKGDPGLGTTHSDSPLPAELAPCAKKLESVIPILADLRVTDTFSARDYHDINYKRGFFQEGQRASKSKFGAKPFDEVASKDWKRVWDVVAAASPEVLSIQITYKAGTDGASDSVTSAVFEFSYRDQNLLVSHSPEEGWRVLETIDE